MLRSRNNASPRLLLSISLCEKAYSLSVCHESSYHIRTVFGLNLLHLLNVPQMSSDVLSFSGSDVPSGILTFRINSRPQAKCIRHQPVKPSHPVSIKLVVTPRHRRIKGAAHSARRRRSKGRPMASRSLSTRSNPLRRRNAS